MRTYHHRRRTFQALIAAGAVTLAGAACQPLPPPLAIKPPAVALPVVTKPTVTPPTVTPPPLTKVNCAVSGTLTVNTSIAANVKSLIAAAKASGLNLCGGAYRDAAAQIATRKANCGTTTYDIYQKPSGQCSPPTAIPGTSMHEQGLAIDWTNCSTRTTNCYTWLSANAATYGLKNLPSEPWHWSTNGH